jgi:hypothetical protein
MFKIFSLPLNSGKHFSAPPPEKMWPHTYGMKIGLTLSHGATDCFQQFLNVAAHLWHENSNLSRLSLPHLTVPTGCNKSSY